MHKTIPKKFGTGDAIMLSTHDLNKPWYATRVTPERIEFNQSFRAPRGNIVIEPAAIEFAERHNITERSILIEPHIKGLFSSTNKAWPWDRWQAVANSFALRGYDLVQACDPTRPVLRGVRHVPTRDVWQAVAILAQGHGVVTTEGALHHAAGALRKPAVVIWTAYSDPKILGYDDHYNLYHPDDRGLGQRFPCTFCEESARKISVADVVWAIQKTFPRSME